MGTILGISCAGGVVVVGDRLLTADGHVRGTRRHVFDFDRVGVAAVGDDVEQFAARLESELRAYRTDRGPVRITPLARMASDLAPDCSVAAAVAAPDESGTPALRATGPDGGVTTDALVAFGSGASVALGSLEASHDSDASLDTAETLARNALSSAAERDPGTGEELDAFRLPACISD